MPTESLVKVKAVDCQEKGIVLNPFNWKRCIVLAVIQYLKNVPSVTLNGRFEILAQSASSHARKPVCREAKEEKGETKEEGSL